MASETGSRIQEDFQHDYQVLREAVEKQRRSTGLAALLPFGFALVAVAALLPIVLFARSDANKSGRADTEVQTQTTQDPKLFAKAPSEPAEAIRMLVVALETERSRPRPPEPPLPPSPCLPQEVVNACGFLLDASSVAVLFATNSAEPSPTARAVLERELQCRAPVGIRTASVDGYADTRPPADRNSKLSAERARVVARLVRTQFRSGEKVFVTEEGKGTRFPPTMLLNPPLECQRAAIITMSTQ